MSDLKKIEEKYDIKILKLLNLEVQECRKFKKIRAKIDKKEILEKIYAKDMLGDIT